MDFISSSTHKEQTAGVIATVTETIEIDSDLADDNLQLILDKDCFTLNSNYVDVIDVDNEDDVEIIENVEQTIAIDDDVECVEVTEVQSKSITEKETILLDEDQSKSITEKETLLLEEVCNENVLLSQIIEECINLDDSGSMKRIINKTLIPLYINCNIIYKKSDEFQNSLKRTMSLLETAPRLKFSHLKSLCEMMKYDYYKKKLPLLSQREVRKATASKEPSTAKKRRVKPIKLEKRRKKNISQEWKVAEQEQEVIIINDHVNYVPYKNTNINSTTEKTTEKITSTNNTQIPNKNKENLVVNNKQRNSEIPNKNKKNVTNNNNKQNNLKRRRLTTSQIEISSTQELLKPTHAIEAPLINTEFNNDKVKTLENDIKELKKELAVLEEIEVTCDDSSSPYLRCEQIKAKIVNKYKKICLLMGTEDRKRHEVKLQVAAGHPEGPAKCLEKYLNENIDENGDLYFPDIFDVVECVEKADKIYKLNWNRKQIVQEAESLLKIYGKALQKRRMKREWRDMKSLVKAEMIDPADFDPSLEARLMENRRIGLKNEEELLNRYAQLENETTNDTGFSLTVENDDESSDSEYELDTGTSLSTNIVNNTSVDIVNNIYLDIVKDTGVDVSNNTSRNIVNVSNGIDVVNNTSPNVNTSPNIVNITPNTVNNTGLNVVNSNSVTINNVINNVIEKLINVNPNIVNNTNLDIVNNARPNTVNTNSVTINNTINNGFDIVNNTNVNIVNNPSVNIVDNGNQNVIKNTVTSTTNENNISKEKFKTKISSEALQNTVINVTPIIIFDDQESPKVIEDTQSKTTKIDNIEYNRTIMIEEEELSDKELLDHKPCIDNIVKDYVPSTDKLPDSILCTDKLSDSIISTDKVLDSIIRTDNIPEVSISTTDELPNSICSTDDKLPDSIPCPGNLKERDESSVSEECELEVKVKQEREDIVKLLEELGNNFTATVFDIEDPFLVIEISDSSDSEDEEL